MPCVTAMSITQVMNTSININLRRLSHRVMPFSGVGYRKRDVSTSSPPRRQNKRQDQLVSQFQFLSFSWPQPGPQTQNKRKELYKGPSLLRNTTVVSSSVNTLVRAAGPHYICCVMQWQLHIWKTPSGYQSFSWNLFTVNIPSEKEIHGGNLANSANPDKPPNTQHCEQHGYCGGLPSINHMMCSQVYLQTSLFIFQKWHHPPAKSFSLN